ncbi:dolichyl-diphosphooligosaccharide--protein glycosyltransferase subunit DAD1 [Lates japonicus]|uniref:Dolichyl-diphosphooligosaccharide--protein glycosyltransferase subunit DAD1 n=1 Tax=Lates japonicus TaxID=270547 RepID=A0AAD3MCX1_LATJO|nr:dolichyl-diphosphooligosaccharide--protein glycosyltransferase subunit DAD1 [Lates japonicus]
MSNSVISVISRFLEEYTSTTPNKLKVVDAYLLYILLTGALQFLYCLLVGTFPFNSFLSGFISCVGSFILAVCLRIQINPQNKGDFLFRSNRQCPTSQKITTREVIKPPPQDMMLHLLWCHLQH